MRRVWILAIVALVLAACGGGDSESDTGDEPPATQTSDSEAPSDDGGGDDNGGDGTTFPTFNPSDDEELGGSATFTYNGVTLHFSMDSIVYSPNEAIEDATFESCDPDFFSTGTLAAHGYQVDESGEILLQDNGDLAGNVTIEIPPDDWEAEGLESGDPEVTIDATLADDFLQMATADRAAEVAPGEPHSWTHSDNSVSGTAVFEEFSEVFVVEFEIECG